MNKVFDQGLQQTADKAYAINANAAMTGIGVDDSGTAFAAGTTALDGTNVHSKAFEITPSRSNQTITGQILFATSDANFTHKRLAFVNSAVPDTATPIPGAYGGIDSQSSVGIAKTSAFSLRYILNQPFVNSGAGNNLVVDQGLQAHGELLFNIGTLTKYASMGFDDGASAYAAGNTSFTGATAAISILFDAPPTRSGGSQTVTSVCTIPKGTADNNMNAKTIKRMNLNNQASTVAQTAGAITGLYAGVSAQTIRKELDYSLKFTCTQLFTSA